MKKYLIITFLLITFFNFAFATSNTLLLNTAKDYRSKGLYSESNKNLHQILTNSPEQNIKIETLYLLMCNYGDLGDWDNSIKYSNEVIKIDRFEKYLIKTYWIKIIVLTYKLNDIYIRNNSINDEIVNEIAKIIYELKEQRSTEKIADYSLFVLKSEKISPILKFRLANMTLPYLYQHEFIDDKCYRPLRYDNKLIYGEIPHNQIADKTTLPFFRTYFILLRKVIETDDSIFIKAATSKEKVLNTIKTKTKVLTTDYDKDVFEALSYYYSEDADRAYELKKMIKQNYKDKYKKAEVSYKCGNYTDNTKYSFTDYVFKDVEAYVMTFCSMKKPKREKIDIGNALKTMFHDFFVPRNITDELME